MCASCVVKNKRWEDATKKTTMDYSPKEDDDQDEEKESPPKTSRTERKWIIIRKMTMVRMRRRRVLRKTSKILSYIRKSPRKIPETICIDKETSPVDGRFQGKGKEASLYCSTHHSTGCKETSLENIDDNCGTASAESEKVIGARGQWEVSLPINGWRAR